MESTGAGLPPPDRPLSEFEEHVYNITHHFSKNTDGENYWDIDMPALQLTFDSASPFPNAEVSFLLTVAPKHCNMLGNLHGGCAATLIDTLSSMILLGVSKPGVFQMGGVSRHLSVTYLRPVPVGTRVRLVSRVVSMGKKLALMRSEIIRVDNGSVCMVSDHDKANTDPEVKL